MFQYPFYKPLKCVPHNTAYILIWSVIKILNFKEWTHSFSRLLFYFEKIIAVLKNIFLILSQIHLFYNFQPLFFVCYLEVTEWVSFYEITIQIFENFY